MASFKEKLVLLILIFGSVVSSDETTENGTNISKESINIISSSTTISSITTKTIADNVKANGNQKEILTTEKGPDVSLLDQVDPLVQKARALNLTMQDGSISRLDDVTMEEDDENNNSMMVMMKSKTVSSTSTSTPVETTTTSITTSTTTGSVQEFCIQGEEKYKVGQTFDRGCSETCQCLKAGATSCQAKCRTPFVPKGSNKDETCMEKSSDTDSCCVTVVCTVKDDTVLEMTKIDTKEGCVYKNGTYKTGEQFNDGCEAVCKCEDAGHISCLPRCPPKVHNSTSESSDRCVALPDPNDSCCMVVLCDVSIQEHDVHKAGDIDMDEVELLSASILNSTSIKIETSQMLTNFTVDVNDDKEWKAADSVGYTVVGLEPGKTYKLRIRHKGDISNEITVVTPNVKKSSMCEYKGKNYTRGEDFHDGCQSFCVCAKNGVECAHIECPTDFGLDVLDPHCIEWETHPQDFTPSPPHCCPEKVTCKNNGSCTYNGHIIPNWSEVPQKITGCDQRCFCETGNVTCQRVCPEVPKEPPPGMLCPEKEVVLKNIPGDECCMFWQCPSKNESGKTSGDSEVITSTETMTYYLTSASPQKPDLYKDYHKSKPYGDSKSPYEKKEKEKEKYHSDKEKDKDKNMTKQDANFLGPFNPTYYQKNASKHDFIDDILTPFHLQDYAQEIKDNLKNNKTTDEYEDYQDNNGGIEHGGLDHYLGNKKNIWGTGEKPATPFKQSGIYYPGGKDQEQDPLLIHERPFPTNKLQQRPENPLVHPGIIGKPNPNQIIQDGNGFQKGNKQNRPDFPIHPQNPLINGDGPQSSDGLYHQYLPNQDIYNSRLPSKYEEQDLGPNSDKEIIHIHSDRPLRVEDIITHIQNKERPGALGGLSGAHGGLPHQHYIDPAHPYNPSAHLHQVDELNKGFNGQLLVPGYPNRPSADEPNEVKVHTLEAVDEFTIRLVFSVPRVFVGLHGRVELRYTSEKDNNDPVSWEQQVLAPPGDFIATPELEFELTNLEPDTLYKIKISVVLRDIQNVPSSQILTVKTLAASVPATTLPPVIAVQVDLRAIEVNSTWAKITWRKFTDFELQFIDGVQLRYKELDGKVYAATPLIHRAVTTYNLEDLRPDATYEVGIFFIPFPGQTTELQAHNTIHISTTIENDPYKFELVMDVHHIKSMSVEVTWSGVPYPEDKYVNIFRVIYQSEGGKEDFSQFKLAKRDLPASNLITDLKPNTRYRLWLEAYLTNGRIKKSNVKDFVTKAGPLPVASTQQGKLEATPLVEAHDYYGPLVIVSILAALAIVSTLVLLLILAKKHGHNKAPITAATRKPHSAAYDNPSYKTSDNDPEAGKRNGSNGVHIPMTIMQPSS